MTSSDGRAFARRRGTLTRTAIAAAAVGVLTASFLNLTDRAESNAAFPPPTTSDGVRANFVPARAALARATLRRQQHALLASSRRGYLDTWSVESKRPRDQAAAVYANLRALGTTITDLRYVGESPTALNPRVQPALDGRRWTADVQVTWRLPGHDVRPARSTLTFTFVRQAATAYVTTITATDRTPQPLWLQGRLRVVRSHSAVTAAATTPDADRLNTLLRQAVRNVRRVLPNWHGSLLAYEPRTASDLAETLGTSAGGYDGIAAVTASVDGSTGKRAPVAILVNPAVFGGLSSRGAAVVVTHEAAHAATGAAAVPMPLWVAEGFADYVAIGPVEVPLSVSAGALTQDIRRHGLPGSLPGDGAFAASGTRLEVSYEQAWLAFRVIAEEYGRARLVRFYARVVDAPTAVSAALRSELGTTRVSLTRRWRTTLRSIAHAT